MKYTYPAIYEDDEAGWIAVHFYEHDDWYTCGRTLKEAFEYATDILNIKLLELITDGKPLPQPVPLDQVVLADNQAVRPVTADPDDYAKIEEQLQSNPIRYAREQAGMNIKELADYLEAPYRTVQDWNAGLKRPPKWCERLIFDKIMELKK